MRCFISTILFIFSLNTLLFSQDIDHHLDTVGLGVYNSFHKQLGAETVFEYERLLAQNWIGLYVQGRICTSDNFDRDITAKRFSTDRFDSAIGYRQYFTPAISIWRPYAGFGSFITYQIFKEELTSNSYLTTNEVSFGVEWELMNRWVVDSYFWSVGYKGTYYKINVFSENIHQYENHLIFYFGYCF